MTIPAPKSDKVSRSALAARLTSLRTEAGLSGNALARRMGIVQSRVWKIEHGELLPTEDDIRAWVRATGQRQEVEGELTDMLAEARVEYQTFKAAYRKGGGGANLLEQPFALLCRQALGIIDAARDLFWIEHDGGGDHRPGQRPPACLVAAGDHADALRHQGALAPEARRLWRRQLQERF